MLYFVMLPGFYGKSIPQSLAYSCHGRLYNEVSVAGVVDLLCVRFCAYVVVQTQAICKGRLTAQELIRFASYFTNLPFTSQQFGRFSGNHR